MKKLILGYILSLMFLISFTVLNPYMGIVSKESELDNIAKLFVVIAAVSGLILFMWMIADFFKRKTLKYKVLWGILFFTVNILAAPFYYLVIYYPSEKSKLSAKIQLNVQKK